ncbi:formylglycine-generating enzyme family protein [Kitasatospora acidiphila]|uniref:Formylglycine-generating enzyme family protein n=1 Tax=Kitasatospora acidiphila TaxID=2567942 RepID=A0A540W950_9ACTN|nr:SUMF1/EgtB/PvdO family nonheme iron enzyme [Kitasatospora acidiphila]TQF05550.1 formylglycine-generating enzyme family protein [Kitasatospora acidiphila]
MENNPDQQLVWVPVPGGICLFGDRQRRVKVPDLEWTVTPLTLAQAGQGGGALPLTGLVHAQAARLAADLGGRLPRSSEWEWAASGPGRRLYPWGGEEPGPGRANLRGGPGRLTAVDAHPDGVTQQGLLDMGGNCWEWTSSPTIGGGFIIRGGSYNSLSLYARCTFLNAAPAELGSAGIGVRVVRAT